jgi:hypothetical protein
MTPRDIAESLVHWPEEDLPQGIVLEDCAFLVANAYLALEQKLAIAKEALDEFLGPNNVGRVIDLSLDWGGSAVSIITDAALLNKLNDARKALEELGE